MQKILVTGGTVFVSRFIAEYYVAKGCEVWVLNRNTRPQSAGVRLIRADRHALGDSLHGMHFDVVIDTGYTAQDVSLLLDALDSFDDYILISSSAVYPETTPQPFREDAPLGINRIWGKYGTDKIAAETVLRQRVPQAFILRPPYLYGPMNNVYREAFVFDCALADRAFRLPKDGSLPLQFFHIRDLCAFMDILLTRRPAQRIFNVGNPQSVSAKEWAALCYQAAGKQAGFVHVPGDIDQRSYFSFYDYAYQLDVSAQTALMPDVTPLLSGLQEAFGWYVQNQEQVRKKPFLAFIDEQLSC